MFIHSHEDHAQWTGKEFQDAADGFGAVADMGLGERRVAVEVNREIVPRSQHEVSSFRGRTMIALRWCFQSEVSCMAVPAETVRSRTNDPLVIAGRTYTSRLLVGTGKYKDLEETRRAVEASGAQIITIAVRRTNIGQNPNEPSLLDVLPPLKYTYLPNTAGCYSAEDAVRTCRLARELLDGHDLVKLEVLGSEKTLYPDIPQTLTAAETLIKDGFKVMVYTNDDPIVARRFAEMGCVAVMPLAAPIGSGLGIRNPYNIRFIVEEATVPVLVDAGVGTASDAAIAMELGCDGVLMNTAIAAAQNPVLMAQAMRKAIEAGREAYLAGRMPRKQYGSPSSPLGGRFSNKFLTAKARRTQRKRMALRVKESKIFLSDIFTFAPFVSLQ
jgi:thiazole synthase